MLTGLAVFGYMAWQPWYTKTIIAKEQAAEAAKLTSGWTPRPNLPHNNSEGGTATVPVAEVHGNGEVFGVLYVPAFGPNWANKVASGEHMMSILNDRSTGVAHYPDTNIPGQKGNFVLAAHRSGGRATPFHDLDFLRIGDNIYLETPDGWYTYEFRDFEYVLPNEVDILNPYPHLEGTPGEDSILTFTSCNPKYYGINERMIAYSTFKSFTPRSDGPPADMIREVPMIADQAAAQNQGGAS